MKTIINWYPVYNRPDKQGENYNQYVEKHYFTVSLGSQGTKSVFDGGVMFMRSILEHEYDTTHLHTCTRVNMSVYCARVPQPRRLTYDIGLRREYKIQ